LLVCSITYLPVILKGILTADDATIAADLGVAAILVSNHGARQLDGTPASVSIGCGALGETGSHTIYLNILLGHSRTFMLSLYSIHN
jgi:hypothetical protein